MLRRPIAAQIAGLMVNWTQWQMKLHLNALEIFEWKLISWSASKKQLCQKR